MTAIKIHAATFAPNAQRVLACLHEKELDYEFIPVNMINGAPEHKQAPFISINPFGQVPALEDGDLKLYESRAINKYISYAYADKGTPLVFNNDPRKMAIVFVGLEVEAHRYSQPAEKLTRELYINPLLGRATDDAFVKEQEAELAKVLDVYEAGLARSKYLCGDTFTLADLNHLPTLEHLMKTRVKAVFDERPCVRAWCANILARPAWLKVVDMRNSKSTTTTTELIN